MLGILSPMQGARSLGTRPFQLQLSSMRQISRSDLLKIALEWRKQCGVNFRVFTVERYGRPDVVMKLPRLSPCPCGAPNSPATPFVTLAYNFGTSLSSFFPYSATISQLETTLRQGHKAYDYQPLTRKSKDKTPAGFGRPLTSLSNMMGKVTYDSLAPNFPMNTSSTMQVSGGE